MSWTTVVLVLVAWCALSVPVAIVVGLLLRRTGAAYAVDLISTPRTPRTTAVMPLPNGGPALSVQARA